MFQIRILSRTTTIADNDNDNEGAGTPESIPPWSLPDPTLLLSVGLDIRASLESTCCRGVLLQSEP